MDGDDCSYNIKYSFEFLEYKIIVIVTDFEFTKNEVRMYQFLYNYSNNILFAISRKVTTRQYYCKSNFYRRYSVC